MGSISISGTGSASGITINTTPITGGTSPRVLFDNGATVGEAAHFTISGGQPSVAAGFAYLYGTDLIAYGIPASQSWFYGNAGNTTQTGGFNTGIGDLALQSVTIGGGNVAFGTTALQSLTSGGNNTAMGQGAMKNETTGGNNVAIGASVLQGAGNNDCFAVGNHACSIMAGGSFVFAFGSNTLVNCPVTDNTIAMGANSMSTNVVTGGQNTCVGSDSGQRITSGSKNTLIGFAPGANITTGDHNTCIGSSAGGLLTTGRANTIFGNVDVAAGLANAIVLADGDKNTRLDYNSTNANIWTLAQGLQLSYITTQGILVTDTSGNVTSDSTTAAATVTANFTADHRLQITIGGTTFYIAMSTTPW